MLETAGTTMTDIKGGVVWDIAAGASGHTLAFDPVLRTVTPSMSPNDNPVPLTSGAWAPLIGESQSMLILAGGEAAASVVSGQEGCRIAFGDGNGLLSYPVQAGWGLAGYPMHLAIKASTGTEGASTCERNVATGPDNGTDMAGYTPGAPLYVDAALNGRSLGWLATYTGDLSNDYFVADASSWTKLRKTTYSPGPLTDQCTGNLPVNGTYPFVPEAPAGTYYPHEKPCHWILNPTTGLDDGVTNYMQPNPCMRIGGVKMFGLAVFIYDGPLPAGYEAMCAWTVQRWMKKDRVIHPGLL